MQQYTCQLSELYVNMTAKLYNTVYASLESLNCFSHVICTKTCTSSSVDVGGQIQDTGDGIERPYQCTPVVEFYYHGLLTLAYHMFIFLLILTVWRCRSQLFPITSTWVSKIRPLMPWSSKQPSGFDFPQIELCVVLVCSTSLVDWKESVDDNPRRIMGLWRHWYENSPLCTQWLGWLWRSESEIALFVTLSSPVEVPKLPQKSKMWSFMGEKTHRCQGEKLG